MVALNLPLWRVCAAVMSGCALLGAACREPARPPPATLGVGGSEQTSARGALTPSVPDVVARARVLPLGEQQAPVEIDSRLQPPDRPQQRLAFTEQRLAQLEGQELVVRSVPDMRPVARIDMPGARNVVAGVGGDFVAAGSEHVYRLAKLDDRAELLAPVPRLGPTTLLPGADSSDHFWLLYEGIPTLPEFDLQETIVAPYISVLSWTRLSEFDGSAISNPGDGSFVYTTPRGLRRVTAEGQAYDVSAASLGSRIWRLLPAGRGRVWAATPYLVQLLRLAAVSADGTEPSPVLQRIELPQHAVALGKQGSTLAALAVENFERTRARLRVELYQQGSDDRRVLRFDDPVAVPEADAGAGQAPEFAPPFMPEVALAPGRSWLAVFGYGLSVFDWRTGKRLFPKGASDATLLLPVQNLAPGLP